MDLLDILQQNKKYNEEHPNEYPKRPESFIKHYRILGKHNSKAKLFKKSIDIRDFFYETANISSLNTYIGFVTDKLTSFQDEDIIWVDGRYFQTLLEISNREYISIDKDRIYHTTDELRLSANELGKIVSDYMIAKNITIETREAIKQLIDDFYNGNNNEFYIIMNPQISESTKYSSDNRIIIPDKDILYSQADIDEIDINIEKNIKTLRKNNN